jgi:hypothetical protein
MSNHRFLILACPVTNHKCIHCPVQIHISQLLSSVTNFSYTPVQSQISQTALINRRFLIFPCSLSDFSNCLSHNRFLKKPCPFQTQTFRSGTVPLLSGPTITTSVISRTLYSKYICCQICPQSDYLRCLSNKKKHKYDIYK